GFYLALVAATLPALGAGLYLVGFDPAELIWTFFLLLVTGGCCGMAAIAAPASAGKTMCASGRAIVCAVASVTVLPSIAGAVLWIPYAVSGTGRDLSLFSFTPPGMLAGIYGQAFGGLDVVVVAVLSQLVLAKVWFCIAQAGLRAVSPEPP